MTKKFILQIKVNTSQPIFTYRMKTLSVGTLLFWRLLAKTEKWEKPFICKVNIGCKEKEGLPSFNPRKCTTGQEGFTFKHPNKESTTNPAQCFVHFKCKDKITTVSFTKGDNSDKGTRNDAAPVSPRRIVSDTSCFLSYSLCPFSEQ